MPHTGSDTPMTANADQAEIAKFQALAHRWWDPNSKFRPLQEINPQRKKKKKVSKIEFKEGDVTGEMKRIIKRLKG